MGILKETFYRFLEWLREHLGLFSSLFNLANPYITAYLMYTTYRQRGYFAVGGELIVPLVIWFAAWYLRKAASKLNYGDDMPRPLHRFTTVGPDGMVTVPGHRVNELVMYMADLEDYLERS